MASNPRSGNPILIFLSLLCLISGIADALIVHGHHSTASLSRFIMWCPGLAALGSCMLQGIPIGSLGWKWPAPQFLLTAYVLPLFYATPVYVITWLSIRGSFALPPYEATMAAQYGLMNAPVIGTWTIALPLLFTITVIGTAVWTLGEELGWRGYLFPLLQQRFGFNRACLLSGALWAIWHYPSLLGADYNAGTNPPYALVCFTVTVIAMAFIMGYLRVCSGSLWPCVLLHATHNTFVQGIFDPLTTPTGWAKYITSEFGIGITVAMVIAAVYVVATGQRTETV